MNKNKQEISLAKPLAPEDIAPGTSVAITHQIAEVFWPPCDEYQLAARGPMLRVEFMAIGECHPMEVLSVCLPFVLVKLPNGERRTLDVRRCRLARLSTEFARKASKKHAAASVE